MDQQAAIEYVLALAREHRQPDVDLMVERSERLSLRVLNGQVDIASGDRAFRLRETSLHLDDYFVHWNSTTVTGSWPSNPG